MKFVAVQKNTRQTPRKVRLVANQLKGLSLEQTLKQLAVIERKSTLVLLKTLKQAIANAQNNHGVPANQLEVESS
jgi:large subunit ribosomal protein L22